MGNQGSEVMNVGLCAGRHEMPVSEFIWSQIDNPMEFDELELHARNWLLQQNMENVQQVNVYITGLTVALTSFLNAWESVCQELEFEMDHRPYLYLLHYDRDTNSYKPQNWLGWE